MRCIAMVIAFWLSLPSRADACSCVRPLEQPPLTILSDPSYHSPTIPPVLPTNARPVVQFVPSAFFSRAGDLRLALADAGFEPTDGMQVSPVEINRSLCGGSLLALNPPQTLQPNSTYRLWVNNPDAGPNTDQALFVTGSGPDTQPPPAPMVLSLSTENLPTPECGEVDTCSETPNPSALITFQNPDERLLIVPVDTRFGRGRAGSTLFITVACNGQGDGISPGHHDMDVIAIDGAGNGSEPTTVSFDATCTEHAPCASDGGFGPLQGASQQQGGCSCGSTGLSGAMIALIIAAALGLRMRTRRGAQSHRGLIPEGGST
ncbi:MAG: hypothetical protein ACJ790_12960 [Myxococcaceae bacterium]